MIATTDGSQGWTAADDWTTTTQTIPGSATASTSYTVTVYQHGRQVWPRWPDEPPTTRAPAPPPWPTPWRRLRRPGPVRPPAPAADLPRVLRANGARLKAPLARAPRRPPRGPRTFLCRNHRRQP